MATSGCTVRMSSRESSLDTSSGSDYLKYVDREHGVATLMRMCTVLHCSRFRALRLRSSFLVIVELPSLWRLAHRTLNVRYWIRRSFHVLCHGCHDPPNVLWANLSSAVYITMTRALSAMLTHRLTTRYRRRTASKAQGLYIG